MLAIQELLKNPEKYFTEIYLPYEAMDTLKYVHEGKQPAYHKYSCCPKLNSDYEDFEIPLEIREKGPEVVEKFCDWFNTVKHLLEKPDVFVARLQARWGIITNNFTTLYFSPAANKSFRLFSSVRNKPTC